jgi:hypothetical protein
MNRTGVCYLRGLSSTWPMGLRENVLKVCLVAQWSYVDPHRISYVRGSRLNWCKFLEMCLVKLHEQMQKYCLLVYTHAHMHPSKHTLAETQHIKNITTQVQLHLNFQQLKPHVCRSRTQDAFRWVYGKHIRMRAPLIFHWCLLWLEPFLLFS